MTGSNLAIADDFESEFESAELTRVPPTDLNAEAAVCASVLIALHNDGRRQIARSLVRPEHMYSEAHRRILEAAYAVEDAGKDVDTVTVASQLSAKGRLGQVGGMNYLLEIQAAVPAVSHVKSYAEIVVDRWRVRKAQEACIRIEAKGYSEAQNETQAYIEEAISVFSALGRMQPGREAETLSDAIMRIATSLQTPIQEGEIKDFAGIPTGFRGLDDRLRGLHPGRKVTIAALPGHGKTTLALQIARNVASLGIGVLLFSVEQTLDECTWKLISGEAGVPIEQIQLRKCSPYQWQKVYAAATKLKAGPIQVVAVPRIDVARIRAEAVRRVDLSRATRNPVGLIVVDHLHEMGRPSNMRDAKMHDVVAHNSSELKTLALELKLPLVELAQQKPDDKDKRENRPGDNCIQWSSKVQESADAVVYLYRERQESKEAVTAIIHKNRFGPTADVPLQFHMSTNRFLGEGQEFEQ